MGTFVDDLVAAAMAPKQQFYVIKLPCCGISVQVKRTGDQYLTCPSCHRHSALTWGRKPTLTMEVNDGHQPNLSCSCASCLSYFH